MNSDTLESRLPIVVARNWGLEVRAIEPICGGMNSSTATITTPIGRFVAKWVPAQGRDALVVGAHAAQLMSERGIRSGTPFLSLAGALTASFGEGELVLLEEVPGTPLSGSPDDQEAWGATLALIHSSCSQPSGHMFYAWLSESGNDPIHDPWVRRAIATVFAEYAHLPPLTWALLHTDPAPEAFIRDDSGNIGVIDWAGSVSGPVLYDVASAVMYAGGEQRAQRMLSAYLKTGVVPEAELRNHLGTLRRLRASVQADYFSKRLRQHDLTGVQSDEDNAQGLRDAREMLQSLGVQTH